MVAFPISHLRHDVFGKVLLGNQENIPKPRGIISPIVLQLTSLIDVFDKDVEHHSSHKARRESCILAKGVLLFKRRTRIHEASEGAGKQLKQSATSATVPHCARVSQ